MTKQKEKTDAKKRLEECAERIQAVGDIGDDIPDSNYVAHIPDLGDLPLFEPEPDPFMFFRRSLFSISTVKAAHVGQGARCLIVSVSVGSDIHEMFDSYDEAMSALNEIKKAKGWTNE